MNYTLSEESERGAEILCESSRDEKKTEKQTL